MTIVECNKYNIEKIERRREKGDYNVKEKSYFSKFLKINLSLLFIEIS